MKQGIDIKIFGLTGDVQDINAEVYAILDKCFTHISAGKKTVNKSGVLAYLVEEIEAQSCDYTRKLYRVAIEMVGMTPSE
ncbi:hypothetical protein SerAS12_2450 [Serratia sp. AS12]|jgi:hypothetical protein|uniref:hypothetical protein n=1 Tax=Serratia TaxID=613 RepID=UPI00020E9D48|nr:MULTISPECIES: hypothetical protein [Serratia]AEF45572.1 hypothetical protein SerAS9_2449 [Serratia plymuthica AS9]AEF50523.1 hypothetical protein SerAS12_2450 [Serratia sp. AS12]AEG28230.1 hypothetical protein SerAS13_2451 [Serratia sp. AS13]MBJ7890790.1 hypothetical protein [Serratia sp. PAMC26656]UNK25770.1 hypothetical protein MNO11_12915 [Serratia plymuthica]